MEERFNNKIQVMILGVFHFTDAGRHVIASKTEDISSPKRQREIKELIENLAKWRPEIIAVEYPYKKQDELNSLYRHYLENFRFRGEASYLEGSEIVQIGFRLGKLLKHKKLLAIDWFPEYPNWLTKESIEKVMYYTPKSSEIDKGKIADKHFRKLKELTISEYLYWLNSEPQININDTMMIDIALDYPAKRTAFAIASNWFERNLGIVRNLKESLPPDIRKVLVIYGMGHVPMLKYIIERASIFRLVSPLAYLNVQSKKKQ